MYKKICKICNKQFMADSKNQKYCSKECKDKRNVVVPNYAYQIEKYGKDEILKKRRKYYQDHKDELKRKRMKKA